MKKNKKSNDMMKIKGFFRIQIEEDGKIKSDSGWCKNQVTNNGIRDYLVNPLMGVTGKEVRYAALGGSTAPASNATALPDEFQHAANNNRLEITGGTSVVASRTAQFTGQFASAASYVTAATTIANIGLFSEQSDTGADLFAGQTYASSTLATNQNVNFTYQIQISD